MHYGNINCSLVVNASIVGGWDALPIFMCELFNAAPPKAHENVAALEAHVISAEDLHGGIVLLVVAVVSSKSGCNLAIAVANIGQSPFA